MNQAIVTAARNANLPGPVREPMAAPQASVDLGRIKANVGKMVQKGAPKALIDQYIAGEGVTVDQVKAFKPSAGGLNPQFDTAGLPGKPLTTMQHNDPTLLHRPMTWAETAADKFESLGTGLTQGVTGFAGLQGTLSDARRKMAGKVAGAVGADPETGKTVDSVLQGPIGWLGMLARRGDPEAPNPIGIGPIQQQVESAVPGSVDYTPNSFSGKVLQTGASFAVGSPVKGLVRGALLPAAAYETADKVLPEGKFKEAAKIGSAILAPSLLKGGAKLTTLPISAERARLAEIAGKEGVPLSAGQKTGSKMLRYAESELGGSRAKGFNEEQQIAFNRAALQRVGHQADHLTPEVMNEVADETDRIYRGLEKRNVLNPDSKMASDLGEALRNYNSRTTASTRVPRVQEVIADIVTRGNANVPGEAYQNIRSQLERDARQIQHADPLLAQTYRGIRGALDDAMERTIAKSNPADLGAWRAARRRYRNQIVLESAMTGAAEDIAMGNITPAKLAQATKQKHGGTNWLRGEGDFADLSRMGQGLLKPLADSGTASRLAVRGLGGIAGYNSGDDLPTSLAGAFAGMMGPKILGRAILSRPGRALLGNQLLRGTAVAPDAFSLTAQGLRATGRGALAGARGIRRLLHP